MPLLHTWSLAVEEQFYILLPIFLILSWRFGKNRIFWFIAIMAATSFLISEWGWRNKPIANFYLLPTRAWELFVGSMAAFIIQKKGIQKNDTLSLIGFGAIIISIFAFDESTPFPSYYSLVPVFGAFILILFADKETFVAKFLSKPLFVGIGLISYSAYLLHQPLFAFIKLKFSDGIDPKFMGLISISTLFLAYFSWKYIEKPFRDKSIISQKQFFLSSLIAIFIFTSIGLLGIKSKGFENRFSQEDLLFLSVLSDDNGKYVPYRFNILKDADWTPNKKKVLLIGDSYAQDLTNAIYESEIIDHLTLRTWYVSTRCGNLYIPLSNKLEFIEPRDLPNCTKHNYFIDQQLNRLLNEADEVWLASAWKSWQIGLLENSLGNLKAKFNGKILIFGRKDFPPFEPKRYLGMAVADRVEYTESIHEELIELNELMMSITKSYNFIDIQSLICGGEVRKCKVFDNDGKLKTYDGGHLTPSGSKFYGKKLSELHSW